MEISGSETTTVREECRSKCSQLPTIFYSGLRMVGLNRSMSFEIAKLEEHLTQLQSQTKVQSQLDPNVYKDFSFLVNLRDVGMQRGVVVL